MFIKKLAINYIYIDLHELSQCTAKRIIKLIYILSKHHSMPGLYIAFRSQKTKQIREQILECWK